MRKHTTLIIALFGMAIMVGSCRKNDFENPPPPPANEGEVITTLRLLLTSAGGVEHKLFSFYDADGEGGGIAPLITADSLSRDSTYTVEILILNETTNPPDTTSNEIADESDDHQFFFQVSGTSTTVSYADTDANGDPLGLLTTWFAGSANSGTVTVTLRHLPNKNAAGVPAGDISNAGGETDIEVVFPLVVQ